MIKLAGFFLVLFGMTDTFADTTVVLTSGAIQSVWNNGLPSETNPGTINIDGLWTYNGSTDVAGWVVTQSAGTLTRAANAVTLDGNSRWQLDGGLISATDNSLGKAHVRVGTSAEAGELVMTGGAVCADGYFDVGYNSLFCMSGGTVAGAVGSRLSNGGQAIVDGGSGTFGTVIFSNPGTQLEFSGGSWTVSGTFTFSSNTDTGSIVRFVLGAGTLSVGGLSMAGSGGFDFVAGTEGSLTVSGYDQNDFEDLWDTGRLKADGKNEDNFSDHFVVSGSTLMALSAPVMVPSFESCSLYWGDTNLPSSHTVQVKEAASNTWKAVHCLSISPDNPEWRGSLFNLQEDTQYDVRILAGTETVARGAFKTWSSTPTIAATYTLAEIATNGLPLIITEQGTPDGWIRIVGTEGSNTLDGGESVEETVLFTNAAYVIFENVTVRGGIRHGITVRGSKDIRILNCEISGFGRIGEQALWYGGDGRYYDGTTLINNDAGVNMDDGENVVVERCFIHSPRSTANPWRFSHPAGPNAVYVKSVGGTVLRYNDFIGCDTRRWNDAVEGWYNREAGLFCDADVFGNSFAFANDDGIELDGAQMNIRAGRNRFEQAYCGISAAPCMDGPSYIFQNLISNLGDEDDFSSNALKNNYSIFGYGPLLFFNNTVLSKYNLTGTFGPVPVGGLGLMQQTPGYVKVTTRNNVFVSETLPLATAWPVTYTSDVDYDLLYSTDATSLSQVMTAYSNVGQCSNAVFSAPAFCDEDSADYALATNSPGLNASAAVPGLFAGGGDLGAVDRNDIYAQLPYRPLPVAVDKGRVWLNAANSNDSITVTATGSSAASSSLAYTVRKTDGCDWFSVSPTSGTMQPGGTVTFTVSLNADELPEYRRGAGVFLIRFADGLSRPVFVYTYGGAAAESIWIPEDSWNWFAEAETVMSNVAVSNQVADASNNAYAVMPHSGTPAAFSFNIPTAGDYQVLLRLKTMDPPGGNIVTALTHDGVTENFLMRADETWRWCGVVYGTKSYTDGGNRHYAVLRLSAGTHTFSFVPSEDVAVDAVLVTDCLQPAE